MTKPIRDVYILTESDLENPITASMMLTQILSQIADRLDRLEGTRGVSTIQYPIDVVDADGNIIGGFTNVSTR